MSKDTIDLWVLKPDLTSKKPSTSEYLSYIFSHYTNAPKTFTLKKQSSGKPFINGPIKFNISHSYQLWVAALTLNDEIGVDIEYIKNRPSYLKIAKRMFEPKHYKSLLQSANPLQNFYDYWTQLESTVKCQSKSIHSYSPNNILLHKETPMIIEDYSISLCYYGNKKMFKTISGGVINI